MRLGTKSGITIIADQTTNIGTISLDPCVPVPGLFNTGVNDSGGVLSIGKLEQHYTMTGVENTAYVVGYYSTYWITPPAGSAWIGPDSVNTSSCFEAPSGNYTYKLTFDLKGLDPSKAHISGSWASGDSADMYFNGVSTRYSIAGYNALSLHPFQIDIGFISGINTLEFRFVHLPYTQGNGCWNPTGLLVTDLHGEASPTH